MTQVWNNSSKPLTGSSALGINAAASASTLEDRDIEDQVHSRLIRDLDDAVLRTFDPERAREQVEQAARVIATQMFPTLAGDRKEDVVGRVVDEVLGLGPIEPLLRDPSISEVMVNGAHEVYFERDGVLYESPTHFRDNAHVFRMIDRIVSAIGRHVDEASPMVDARLADGSRVNVIIPPLTPKGPVVTIRRFQGDRYTMEDLAGIGTLTYEMAALLEACVRARMSIVVSGGTGSGKTTLLNALSAFIPGARAHRHRRGPDRAQAAAEAHDRDGGPPAVDRGPGRGDPSLPGAQRAAHAPRPHPRRRGPRLRGVRHAPGDEHRPRRLDDHGPREHASRRPRPHREHGADGRASSCPSTPSATRWPPPSTSSSS